MSDRPDAAHLDVMDTSTLVYSTSTDQEPTLLDGADLSLLAETDTVGMCATCGEPLVMTFWGLVGDGGVCRDHLNPNDDDEGQHVFVALPSLDAEPEAHCFVCHRHTDHWGEHDDLVEAGLATYREDGSVFRTESWDAAEASRIVEATYAAFTERLHAPR